MVILETFATILRATRSLGPGAARQRYEAAKAHKARNAGKLYDAVLLARKIERDARKFLREHIEQHGCAT